MCVVAKASMILAEVPKTEAIQMMLVRGVTEGTVIGVMGSFDMDTPARPHQPVKLFHRFDDVGDMLNHVNGTKLVETVGFERIGKSVKIRQHIGAAGGIVVETNGAGIFIYAATNIKDQGKSMTPRKCRQAQY